MNIENKNVLFTSNISAKKEISNERTKKNFSIHKNNKRCASNDKSYTNSLISSDSAINEKLKINLKKNNSHSVLTNNKQNIRLSPEEIEKMKQILNNFKSSIFTSTIKDTSTIDTKSVFNSNIKSNSIKHKTTQKILNSKLDYSEKTKYLAKTQYSSFFNQKLKASNCSNNTISQIDPNLTFRALQFDDGLDKIKFQKKYKKDNVNHQKEIKRLMYIISTSNFKNRMNKVFSSSSTNFSKNSLSKDNPFVKTLYHTPSTDYVIGKNEGLSSKTTSKSQVNSLKLINTPKDDDSDKLKLNIIRNSVERVKINSVEKDNPLKLIKNYQSKLDQKLQLEKSEYSFRCPEKLKNHLIRDHKIGESNHIQVSKQKFESTMKIYNDIEERKKKKIEKEIKKFYENQSKNGKFIESEENDKNEKSNLIQPSVNIDQEYYESKRDEIKKKLVIIL